MTKSTAANARNKTLSHMIDVLIFHTLYHGLTKHQLAVLIGVSESTVPVYLSHVRRVYRNVTIASKQIRGERVYFVPEALAHQALRPQGRDGRGRFVARAR